VADLLRSSLYGRRLGSGHLLDKSPCTNNRNCHKGVGLLPILPLGVFRVLLVTVFVVVVGRLRRRRWLSSSSSLAVFVVVVGHFRRRLVVVGRAAQHNILDRKECELDVKDLARIARDFRKRY
jgi:hypothetical protein